LPRIMSIGLQRKRLIEIFRTLNPGVDFRVIDWDAELDPTLTFPEQRREMARKFPEYTWSGKPEQESGWEKWYEEYEEDIERRQIEELLSKKYGLKPVSEEVAQIAESIVRAGLKLEDVAKLSTELEEAIRTIAFERSKVEDLERKLKAEQEARARIEAERRALPAVRMEEIRRREEELKKREAEVRRWADELARAQFGLKAKTEALEDAIERVPPPPPPPVKELTEEEVQRLEDLFSATLTREVGRIPTNAMAEFRVEVEKVKTLPYEEAAEHITGLAEDIIAREVYVPALRRIERVRRPPPPKEIEIGAPPEVFVRPTELPPQPISALPFPRSPSSEEREILWRAYSYRLAEIGADPYRYRADFTRYVLDIPYTTWDGLLKSFELFIRNVEEAEEKGIKPFFMPLPSMPWSPEEEKRRRDAIVHFTATKIYKTIDDLITGLALYGIQDVTEEEVREAVRRAWKEKDVWFTSIRLEYLSELLGLPPKEIEK